MYSASGPRTMDAFAARPFAVWAGKRKTIHQFVHTRRSRAVAASSAGSCSALSGMALTRAHVAECSAHNVRHEIHLQAATIRLPRSRTTERFRGRRPAPPRALRGSLSPAAGARIGSRKALGRWGRALQPSQDARATALTLAATA